MVDKLTMPAFVAAIEALLRMERMIEATWSITQRRKNETEIRWLAERI
jgi:hypothetical protein